MSRYRNNNGAKLLDGDRGFRGVDMRREPELLEPGLCSRAVNCRFRQGKVEPRGGLIPLPWFRPFAALFPLEFPIVFDQPVASDTGTVYGAGMFSDPNGTDCLMLAVEAGVLLVAVNCPPVMLLLPAGVRLTGPVELVQAFERVVMFRGPDAAPLVWDGGPVVDGESGFTAISQSAGGGGTDPIPNALTGTVFQNRMLVPFGDRVAVSDILDYTRYDSILNVFVVNEGTSDRLVRAYPFNRQTVIMFKERGIFLVSNLYGDYAQAQQDELTRSVGLVSRRAVATVGQDVWFLDYSGVRSIQSALDNRLQGVAEPVSVPIGPVIDRINWAAAGGACAEVWDNKFYLAVPLDGSTVNNAVLVYDVLNQAWSGWDESDVPGFDVGYWVKVRSVGRERLLAVGLGGNVWLYEEDLEDELGAERFGVPMDFLSRGYDAGEVGVKRQVGGKLELSTWNPEFTVTGLVEGVNEVEAVRNAVTRDGERYVTHGVPPYELDNLNDDHAVAGREDYSVPVGGDDDAGPYLGDNGIDPELHQRMAVSFTLRRRGRRVQVRLTNGRGRVCVHACGVYGVADEREKDDV